MTQLGYGRLAYGVSYTFSKRCGGKMTCGHPQLRTLKRVARIAKQLFGTNLPMQPILRIISALLTCLLCLICAANAGEQTPIVIKFSHVVAADTPKGKAAQRFKELAEKATQGRVRIDIYPDSQLYKDKEELEALQLGAVQMLAPSVAKFGAFGVREFDVFELPYIFPSRDVLNKVTQGPIGLYLLKKLEPKGITGLAFWDNGFKLMSANKPLHHPGDLKGLKMRIQSSRVLDAQMRTLGAIPQVLPFSEVYQALKSGFVDGTENPASNFKTQKMDEVQSDLTISNHGYLGYAVIVNKKFWDGLPGDIRAELGVTMHDATIYANDIAQQENERALADIRKRGKTTIYQLSAQEQVEWRRAMAPVQQMMADSIGKELINEINNQATQSR
jgi:C4-dicarboxylate-binding protein DctP